MRRLGAAGHAGGARPAQGLVPRIQLSRSGAFPGSQREAPWLASLAGLEPATCCSGDSRAVLPHITSADADGFRATPRKIWSWRAATPMNGISTRTNGICCQR
jgi:hypothetical protein